jgi:hypothetical protein
MKLTDNEIRDINRYLELKIVFRECPPGRRKVAVKAVDIFNDTLKII